MDQSNNSQQFEENPDDLEAPLEREEIAVKKRITERKIKQIKIAAPVQVQHLFPSKWGWKIMKHIFAIFYGVLMLGGLLVIILSILGHVFLYKLWIDRVNQVLDSDEIGSITLYCATVKPINRGYVKEYIGLPYASLPMTDYLFYKPGPLLSFFDCYKAFWFNLQPSQRQFKNGRLTFNSIDHYPACKQISRDKRKIIGISACLTLNIKSPIDEETGGLFSQKTENKNTKHPVVIMISGRTYLENRPFSVGDSVVKRSNAIFISINFRLGVLGFANFDSIRSPRNIGIVDFIQALEFIDTYIERFNGDKNNMTLLAEESGATTGLVHMIMKTKVKLFSKIWLIDGSSYIPDPPKRNLFYDMYASPDILCSVHEELDDIFNCLQNFTSNMLLNNTPKGWMSSDKYFRHLPSLFEHRESIVEKIDQAILSPLETVMKVGSDIHDIPTVIMSKLDFMPYEEKQVSSTILGQLTKSQFFTETRLGLLTYQTGISQVVLHKEINAAYNEYIKFVENRSIFNQFVNKDIIPLGFEEVLQAVISDLRVACPYGAIAKYLQVNGHIVRGPIYRIIDGGYRYYNPPTNSFMPCELNFFLQDENSVCKSKDSAIPPEYKETMLKSFIEFIQLGSISKILEMNYPTNSSMKEFEDTFTFVGRLGFRTPGVREVGLLQACNIWKKGSDELPMLKTSAKVN